jgi:hypothetical protein
MIVSSALMLCRVAAGQHGWHDNVQSVCLAQQMWYVPMMMQCWQAGIESFCDVDVRYELSMQEFLEDYLYIQKPVLVKGALAGTCSG